MIPKLVTGLGVVSISVAAPILIKEWATKKYDGKEDLENKNVVITGANSGIGYKLAEELARRKAKVIMACKDDEDCIKYRRQIVNETGNGKVYCSKIDLASLDSITEFVNRINEKIGKVDILVNNAAVMRPAKRTLTTEGFESQLGINHLGHFLLTNLLIDNLKLEDTPARIVNVTCTDYKNGKINFDDINWDKTFDTNQAYKQSKLANVLFSQELVDRLSGSSVNVITVRPPNCRTKIKRNLSYYSSWFGFIPRGFFWLLEYSPPQGAESVVHACLSPEFANKSKSGVLIHNGEEEPVVLPDDAKVQARKLWLISEKWTRLEQKKKQLTKIVTKKIPSSEVVATDQAQELTKSNSNEKKESA